jgi:hypothetical protein
LRLAVIGAVVRLSGKPTLERQREGNSSTAWTAR